MKYVGAHVSISGGVENAPLNAQKIGATAMAMFTKNQRQWQAKPISEQSIQDFGHNLAKVGIDKNQVLVHDSYLINLGNPDPEKRAKSLAAFIDEARRVEQLGLTLLNFHPGSHLNQISEEACMDLIADGIRQAVQATENVVFVLETTAGQGSNIGSTFDELAYIMAAVDVTDRVGVCIDTCHIYTAGYNIKDEYDEVMQQFDEVIGFGFLRGVHLNDSKSTLGQRVDRHHSLGQGNLGWPVFEKIMNDKRFDNIPLILETIDSDIWDEEIDTLNKFIASA